MGLVLLLLPFVFAVIALTVFIRRRQPILRSFGLTVSRWSAVDVGIGFLIPGIAITLVFLTERAVGVLDVTAGTITWGSFATDVLLQLVVAAVIEEVLYRVMLLTGVVVLLDPLTYGRWVAVIVTAALFGAAHLDNEGASWISAVGTGLGGVIYAIAFLGTRSIWLPFALHLAWNMAQGLLGFPISGEHVPGFLTSTGTGDPLLHGGAYGPEAGIVGMLARFLIIALLLVYLRRRYPDGELRTLRLAPGPSSR